MWSVVVLVVLSLELLAGVVLWRQATAVRERVAGLDTEVTALERLAADPDEVPARSSPVNPLISVEILNARELAARESLLARRFGSFLPRVVAREVAARAAAQLAEQLAEQGVRADVRVLAPRQR